MEKKYLNFTIKPMGTWTGIFKDDKFIARVPDEEEARRVIWKETGKGDPITDEMMELINN